MNALLGESRGGPAVDYSLAPARAEDLSGVCPAYIQVGELDILRDEAIAYLVRLSQAKVSTEFHLRQGLPHAFERLAPEIAASRWALEDRNRALRAI